jgi:hypothetical protein
MKKKKKKKQPLSARNAWEFSKLRTEDYSELFIIIHASSAVKSFALKKDVQECIKEWAVKNMLIKSRNKQKIKMMKKLLEKIWSQWGKTDYSGNAFIATTLSQKPKAVITWFATPHHVKVRKLFATFAKETGKSTKIVSQFRTSKMFDYFF